MSKHRKNEPRLKAVEPPADAPVYASLSDCPDRMLWTKQDDGSWMDAHGCRRRADQLVDPVLA